MITACSLKLASRPADYLELFFSLPDEDRALKFHHYLGRLLEGNFSVLNAFEYFGVNCRRFMDHEKRLFHGDNQVALYLQIPLKDKSRQEQAETWFERLLAAGCDIDPEGVLLFDSEPKRRVFMEARHSMPANALEVVQRHGTYTIMTDAVVPPENFARFLGDVHGLLKSEGIDYLSFGHFGDCHLHFTLLPDREKLARATELYDLLSFGPQSWVVFIPASTARASANAKIFSNFTARRPLNSSNAARQRLTLTFSSTGAMFSSPRRMLMVLAQ